MGRTKKARSFPSNGLLLSSQTNLTELKSFGSPPQAVSNVSAAVMALMAPGGKVPKDRSWKAAKVTMAKVDGFLDSLINFDKENIHENCLKAIRPYLQDAEFSPEFVATKSYAAAGLCSWVINIVKFYEVFCDVEPKRQALRRATSDLTAAQEKLAAIKAKIAVSERRPDPAGRLWYKPRSLPFPVPRSRERRVVVQNLLSFQWRQLFKFLSQTPCSPNKTPDHWFTLCP